MAANEHIGMAWALCLILMAGLGPALAAAAKPAGEPSAFLKPPRVILQPGPEYRGDARRFQGIPSLARSPKGRLWAIWYAGKTPKEDHNNYVALVTSGDDGHTWSAEKLIVDPDGEGPVRAFDPQLWLDPDGTLWAFWAQAIGHDGTVGGVWAVTTANPDDENARWSEPRRLTDGVMMCKPFVLSSGEWCLPASTWRQTDRSARIVVSTDRGKTWHVRGGCNVPKADRAYDEHMIVERKDGTLWMLARTRYGIGESVSTDRGATWPELKPSPIAHPSARFFIQRLRSGNILLVKHGPIDKPAGRSHLTAFLSKDDGRSWDGGLLLDERAGVSYPDGVQAEDGTVYIIYDFSRTAAMEILLARFTEEDVLAGKLSAPRSALRLLVNKASGPPAAFGPGHPAAARNPSGLPVRVVVEPPDDPRFAHLSWNKALRTPKGTIVLAYIAGTFHGDHGGGCPAVSRSTDGGQTFTPPKILRQFGPGQDYSHSGNVALGIAEDGALVLLAMAYTGSEANHIFGWRSEDDGLTWAPADTAALGPNKTGSVFGNILPLPGRGLVVLGHYRAGAQPHTSGIWMAVSADHGRSWGAPRRISEANAVEPVLLQSGGRLLAFLRGAGGHGGRQFIAASDDLGATWKTELSPLAPERPASARLAAPCAVVNPAQPGEIIALTTERALPGNTPGRIWLWKGNAKDLAWRRVRVVLEFPRVEGDPHTDFGYPWLVHLDGNRWLMLYYHGRSRGPCPLWATEMVASES